MKTKLLCIECHQPCNPSKGCDCYVNDPEGGIDHVHLAGGDRNYPVCKICLNALHLRHRPIDAGGKWKWLKKCEAGCGFCRN